MLAQKSGFGVGFLVRDERSFVVAVAAAIDVDVIVVVVVGEVVVVVVVSDLRRDGADCLRHLREDPPLR